MIKIEKIDIPNHTNHKYQCSFQFVDLDEQKYCFFQSILISEAINKVDKLGLYNFYFFDLVSKLKSTNPKFVTTQEVIFTFFSERELEKNEEYDLKLLITNKLIDAGVNINVLSESKNICVHSEMSFPIKLVERGMKSCYCCKKCGDFLREV